MQRFIGLIWDRTNPAACSVAADLEFKLSLSDHSWSRQSSSAGMSLYTTMHGGMNPSCLALPRRAGLIIGTLFKMESPYAQVMQLDDETIAKILKTRGRHLVDTYWGSYVAIIHGADTAASFVIRDCSGEQPCFRTKRGPIEIFFSSMGDLYDLRLSPFTLDLGYLAAFILYPDLQIRHTGFNEVKEVLAGECVTINSGGATQSTIWNPCSVAAHNGVLDFESASVALRETTEACVKAWSSVHRRILLSLSGGLDSSIVLGCLSRAQASEQVTCYTVFSRNPREDERRYAQMAGVPLIEINRDSMGLRWDEKLFNAPPAAKPQIQVLAIFPEIAHINEVAAQHETQSIWTGQGGDHLFLQTRSPLGAADYFLHRGLRPGLVRAVADSVRLSKKSYVSVVRAAWRAVKSRPHWGDSVIVSPRNRFVIEDALPRNVIEYISPQWTADLDRLPPGKQSQIFSLADVLNRHRHLPGREFAYQHHPLLSQPLIDLCLRIPTYLLLHNGRSRGLARNAFKNHIPQEIHAREDKGTLTTTVMDLLRESRTFIYELLTDGVLIREKILKPEVVGRWIANREPTRPDEVRTLVASIAAEIWVHSWNRKRENPDKSGRQPD